MKFVKVFIAASGLLSAHWATAADTANADGHQTFSNWCAPCHSNGKYMPGTAALQFKYKGTKPGPLEERKDLTPLLVKTFVRNGSGLMAPFRKTEITDAQLDALAAYLSKQ